jgi:hypothetical protein
MSKKKSGKPKPIIDKNEIPVHPDNKIDQDFPGFPHGHSAEKIINPSTSTEKKVADTRNKDGEKK